MKTKITLAIAVSLLAGCAQMDTNYKQNARLNEIELNQRLISSQLGLTNATMPKYLPYMDGITLGNPNAPYVMMEFTDLQCPFCAKFQTETFPAFKERYIDTGEVFYVAKELPLKQLHPEATGAAVALRCAEEQSKEAYTPYKTSIFESKTLGNDFYLSKAKELALDERAFEVCLSNSKTLDAVNTSYKYAFGLGLTSTPSFIFGKNHKTYMSDFFILKGALTELHIDEALKGLKNSQL